MLHMSDRLSIVFIGCVVEMPSDTRVSQRLYENLYKNEDG